MKTAPFELSQAKEQGLFEISQVAKMTGLNSKAIRYYESVGLIPPARRTRANYRVYNQQDVQMLLLIKRARTLDFSLPQIELLLGLWRNPSRASAEVKQLVLAHVEELQGKIAQMQQMSDTLRCLAADCYGDQRPDCPILDGLISSNPACPSQ